MKAPFESGFEKRAYTTYSSAFPLASEKAKQQYVSDKTTSGRHTGAAAGGFLGAAAGVASSMHGLGTALNGVAGGPTGKRLALHTLGGLGLGMLGGGALGHYSSKSRAQGHAGAGMGMSGTHANPVDAIIEARKYTALNKAEPAEKKAGVVSGTIKELEAHTKTLTNKAADFVSKAKTVAKEPATLDYSSFNAPRLYRAKHVNVGGN
jgi:hypothetical protein